MNTQHEDQLRSALRHQAERGAPHELDLDSVTATARGIRRRRTALAAVASATVIALAVPAGMALTGNLGADDPPPVAGQDTESIEPPSGGLLEVSILDDLETGGAAAQRPVLRGDTILVPGGEALDISGDGEARGLDVLGDGWLVLRDTGDGKLAIETLTSDAQVSETVPAQSGPVVSDDGTVAAYVAPDGEVRTITTEDGDQSFASADAAGPISQIDAVEGSGTCSGDGSEAGGCTVIAERGSNVVVSMSSGGTLEELPGFLRASDVSEGMLLGMVSVDEFEPSTCSVLQDLSTGEKAWRSCDNSFGAISPDGRWAIGFPSYTDGLGPKSVSVVDMADGRERVRFADTSETTTTVFDVRWESDSSLLLTLWDGQDNRWRLLRAELDGTLTDIDAGLEDVRDDPTVGSASVHLG